MQHIIYKITNDVNEKVYVGVTHQLLQDRWSGHLHSAQQRDPKPLYVAMRTLGAEHFYIEPLDLLDCERHIAEDRESYYIRHLGCMHPQGYNLRVPLTNEQVAIIRFNPYGWTRARCAKEVDRSSDRKEKGVFESCSCSR